MLLRINSLCRSAPGVGLLDRLGDLDAEIDLPYVPRVGDLDADVDASLFRRRPRFLFFFFFSGGFSQSKVNSAIAISISRDISPSSSSCISANSPPFPRSSPTS